MNWNRKLEKQPELLPAKPSKVKTRTAAEFFAACERGKAGEFEVLAVNVFGPGTGNGGRNGHYEFEVRCL